MTNMIKHPTVSPMHWLCSSFHKESKILKIVLPEIKKKTLEKLLNRLLYKFRYLFFFLEIHIENIFALPNAYLKVLDCKERKKNLSGMPTI